MHSSAANQRYTRYAVMASEAAALLNELMGANRNADPGDDSKELQFTDKQVCKYHLCGFCPSQLFTNTKSDIGPCDLLHDDKLKKSYETSERRGRLGFEENFLEYLEMLVRDLDRKVTRGRDRLRKSRDAKEEAMQKFGTMSSEKLLRLNSEINELVGELEHLGAMGHVSEAQSLMMKVESLEKERERERARISREDSKLVAGFELDTHDFHEKMELCDVCGSFLVIGDTQNRVDSHLFGKQHIGFARIRATISELKKMMDEQRQQRLDEKTQHKTTERRQGGRRSRSPSRERYRRRSFRGSRSRSRERRPRRESHRRGSRSRSRDRRMSRKFERRRSRSGERRSRSRDRRRSRSRERKQSTKSHERKRSRSHDRKRSRSRDRKRSRSRERKRSKSRERKRSKSPDRKRSRSRERKRSRSLDHEDKSRERRRSRSQEKRGERRDSSPARGQRRRKSGSRERKPEREKNGDDGKVGWARPTQDNCESMEEGELA